MNRQTRKTKCEDQKQKTKTSQNPGLVNWFMENVKNLMFSCDLKVVLQTIILDTQFILNKHQKMLVLVREINIKNKYLNLKHQLIDIEYREKLSTMTHN